MAELCLLCLQGEVGEQGLAGHPGEKVSVLIFYLWFNSLINELSLYIMS